MVWYSTSEQKWYYSYTGGAVIFDTQEEAQRFMAKINTAKTVVRTVQTLALATDDAADLEAEYFDVAGTGWVDADITPLGITAAQLAGCLTLLQQFTLLMTGEVTTPGMYRATLNQVRRVNVPV